MCLFECNEEADAFEQEEIRQGLFCVRRKTLLWTERSQGHISLEKIDIDLSERLMYS